MCGPFAKFRDTIVALPVRRLSSLPEPLHVGHVGDERGGKGERITQSCSTVLSANAVMLMITSTRLRDDEEHPDRTKYTVGIEVVLYSSASALVMTPMVSGTRHGPEDAPPHFRNFTSGDVGRQSATLGPKLHLRVTTNLKLEAIHRL